MDILTDVLPIEMKWVQNFKARKNATCECRKPIKRGKIVPHVHLHAKGKGKHEYYCSDLCLHTWGDKV